MNLYKRYLDGEFKAVYDEISGLQQKAFLHEIFPEVEAVLNETFKRVAVNLEIIHYDLQKIGYLFRSNSLSKPLPDAEKLLSELEKTIKPFGYVPLSIKKFYEIVGACDFVWDYEINEERFWECADPIEICDLNYLVSYTKSEDWEETISDAVEENEKPYLELSADFWHKDNTSGGMPYSIEITKQPSIDGLLLFEPHETTFIDYLRISMDKCGFSLITETEIRNDFKSFFSRVKPQLLKI
jgi:hypothetical protein